MRPGTALERTGSFAAQRRRAAWFVIVAVLAGAVQAAPVYTETVVRAPVDGGAQRVYIDVTVFRPEGAGPFPVVVLSHGSPRTPQARRTDGRQRLTTQALPFLSMGFAVIVPTRRGYGESGGEWAEGYGPCANPDYYTAGLETARDVRAAVDAIRGESWADAKHVVLAGQSAGGFGSVAASAMPFDGLVGVINFAGGRGSLAPQRVCEESRLVEAMARYGAKVHVPSLWLYSTNDQYFGPDLARRMYQAFVQAGASAEFIEAPPTGLDGHSYFARATEDWAPRVMKFLQRIGVKR